MTQDDEARALQLRVQALALLEQAAAIDGMKPFVAVHHDGQQATPFLLWSAATPDEEAVAAVIEASVDPGRGERIAIDSSISLGEISGTDPTCRIEPAPSQEDQTADRPRS